MLPKKDYYAKKAPAPCRSLHMTDIWWNDFWTHQQCRTQSFSQRKGPPKLNLIFLVGEQLYKYEIFGGRGAPLTPLKKWVPKKLSLEPRLLNINFYTHKKPSILKNERETDIFAM